MYAWKKYDIGNDFTFYSKVILTTSWVGDPLEGFYPGDCYIRTSHSHLVMSVINEVVVKTSVCIGYLHGTYVFKYFQQATDKTKITARN